MLKHAYLIMAHHEFCVLERLVSMLDDVRNDIYIHFDKKVTTLPKITTQHSELYILSERVDVRWGNVSQIQSELLLFYNALRNTSSRYSYFHLISGVHLPLKSQDALHSFFESKFPDNIFSYMANSNEEMELKLKRYNYFTRFFIIPNYPLMQRWVQFFWKLLIRLQKIGGIKRNTNHEFIKAANWLSLTYSAVTYLVNNSQQILTKYRYTLCGDEYFVPSELNDVLPEHLVFEDHYLLTEFSGENPKIFENKDYEKLVSSPYLFARKFSHSDLEVVDKICKKVTFKI